MKYKVLNPVYLEGEDFHCPVGAVIDLSEDRVLELVQKLERIGEQFSSYFAVIGGDDDEQSIDPVEAVDEGE